MSNSEYREAQQQARTAGLAKRHEQRLENATYTAAEVKVLTEDACKVAAEAGRRIGRLEMFDELSVAFDRITYMSDDAYEYEHNEGCQGEPDCPACWVHDIRGICAEFSPRDQNAAPELRTQPSGSLDLPPEPQAGSKRCPKCGFYEASNLSHHPKCERSNSQDDG